MNILNGGGVTAPKGFLAAGIHCGLKKNLAKKDLALIYSEVKANAWGVFTKNKVKGAPIYISKEHLATKSAQAIIVNSGNANTCNGNDGLQKSKKMANLVAKELNLKTQDVLVASTGVIGIPLNIDAIKDGIPTLTKTLSYTGSNDAASAIMTTDTFPKELSVKFILDGKEVTIGAIAKGSGMIEPNMGTMLGFITTDVNISPKLLKEALKDVVDLSFNRVSVDGDTSTNDTVFILANGLAQNNLIEEKNYNYYIFFEALKEICIKLSKMIAKDGEGATKLIECTVYNAKNDTEAEILSKSVINSSLVKTAIFGSDANWGRILCALGYSNLEFDPNNVDVAFASSVGNIEVCKSGAGLCFDEAKAKEILSEDTIQILVNMNDGTNSITTWGCDLSYEYVRINGDYRS